MPSHIDDYQDRTELDRDVMIKNTIATTALDQSGDGICRGCESNIPEERLAVLPKATHCIDCQEGLEL